MNGEVVFNGLDGASGGYFVTATPAQIADIARGGQVNQEHLDDVRARLHEAEPSRGVVRTVRDESDLAQTGWGIIFAQEADPAIREALQPLLSYRRQEAARHKEVYYREYVGPSSYHPGETAQEFLRNRGAHSSGSADPEQMPYYLLIVGDPESIPYGFQYQLDVQYAVGRICFDTVAEYASYATSVVQAEKANPRPRRAVFVGVSNNDDRATQLSRQYLVEPLAKDALEWQHGQPPDQIWDVQTVLGAQAVKARVATLLGGGQTPALLFTASHGVGFPDQHPHQLDHQGALVCQDWPGPQQLSGQPIDNFYLSADDIPDNADLTGLVTFHFACFSVGTPRFDDLPQLVNGRVRPTGALGTSPALPMAARSFVARLPQRLLGHPRGGALAVIGHVERALGSSFFEDDSLTQGSSPPVFRGALNQLMRGDRLGSAIEPFNERYAQLCSRLETELRQVLSFGHQTDPVELARQWMGAADARGYAIFGDPAVRLVAPGSVMTDPTPIVATVSAPVESAPSPAPAPNIQSTLSRVPAGVQVDVDPVSGHIRITIDSAAVTGGGGQADSGGPVSYGWPLSAQGSAALGSMRDTITSALTATANRLGTALSDLVAEVSTLEVATYVSDDPDAVTYNPTKHAFEGPARRKLMSCMRLDGDTLLLVPANATEVDERLWQKHSEMLERAQAHRVELIKAMSEAVTNLVGTLTLH